VVRTSAEHSTILVVGLLPATRWLLLVEPRGFEPLTSAVQSQIHNVVVVR
jgi:hypothetical protein